MLVINNQKLKDQFQRYHSALSMKIVNPYYHGTSLKCAIYQSATVCSDESCGICGISQKGMLPKISHFSDLVMDSIWLLTHPSVMIIHEDMINIEPCCYLMLPRVKSFCKR